MSLTICGDGNPSRSAGRRQRPRSARLVGWAVEFGVFCHGVVRSAWAEVRALRDWALPGSELQHLDDRILRDVGILPSKLGRTQVADSAPLWHASWM